MSFLQEKFGFSIVRYRHRGQSQPDKVEDRAAQNKRIYHDPLNPQIHSEEPEYSSQNDCSKSNSRSKGREDHLPIQEVLTARGSAPRDVGWTDPRSSFYDSLLAFEESNLAEAREQDMKASFAMCKRLLERSQLQDQLRDRRNSFIQKKSLGTHILIGTSSNLRDSSTCKSAEVDVNKLSVPAIPMGQSTNIKCDEAWRRPLLPNTKYAVPSRPDEDDQILLV